MTAKAGTAHTQSLDQPVTVLSGVGPERAALLARLEIRTVEDLLLHRPLRYEDRRNLCPIAGLLLHQPAIVHGKIVASGTKWFKHHTKSVFEIVLDDGTARLHCRWWNLPFMEKYFALGDEVLAFGKPVSIKPRIFDHPETEIIEGGEENFIHLNRITPVYPLTEGLPQRWLRGLIWRTLQHFQNYIPEGVLAGWPKDAVGPEDAVRDAGAPGVARAAAQNADSSRKPLVPFPLLSRAEAVRRLHFPESLEEVSAARRRLALEEYLELQMQMQNRRRNFETKAQALPCGGDNHLMRPFLSRLGFKLTTAQTRVLSELRRDMSGAHPMRRLLQGEVGAGKTLVAACCALMALECGYNVALMAPTEILAEQHFLTFSKWFPELGIEVRLQTGSRKQVRSPNAGVQTRGTQTTMKGPAHQTAQSGADVAMSRAKAQDRVYLTIGTHALIEAGFTPENLGLVIIDEQHKFGVAQREELVRKGRYPHLLVMTATPIPRTLGLTLYGELDASTISELPPGRGRTRTFVRGAEQLPKVWAFVRSKLKEGRQAFIVYPRIEDTGQAGIKAVTKECEGLQQTLAPFRIGLLHGRLPSGEKEEVMAAFRANKFQVLLSTSLIEVGVDVPNATIMLIENAEQFGLAQLHQLRGRIGRGAHESFCILVAGARNHAVRERLQTLEQTNDGRLIAEADLRMRGPGELLGQQQSGAPRFRFGDLANDLDLIELSRDLAREIIRQM